MRHAQQAWSWYGKIDPNDNRALAPRVYDALTKDDFAMLAYVLLSHNARFHAAPGAKVTHRDVLRELRRLAPVVDTIRPGEGARILKATRSVA